MNHRYDEYIKLLNKIDLKERAGEIEELIAAVLVQASKDYMAAYKSNDKSKLMETERFFYSEKFRDYTHDGIDPDKFMKGLRQQAKSPEIIHQKRKGDAPKNERIQDRN